LARQEPIEDIDTGLAAIGGARFKSKEYARLRFAPLGAGLGGLDWKQVRSRIERALKASTKCRYAVYDDLASQRPVQSASTTAPPKMTIGRAGSCWIGAALFGWIA